LAVPIFSDGGITVVAIIAWVLSNSGRALDSIAMRPIEGVEGWSTRRRGSYRKAYPGQKTMTSTTGYSERIDDGWDRSSKDLSRDFLDPDRRTWTQITSRRVSYSDSGLVFEGPVNRPDATTVTPRTLPDGSKESIVYLAPNAKLKDRYIGGTQDIISFVEKTERVQEFALDYPVPFEILQTDYFDQILGTTKDPWQRTSTVKTGNVYADDQSMMIDQNWDHPTSRSMKPVGPTTQEGVTPRRRAFIIERSEGTLVGFNRFDKMTYGNVLKPVVFPYTKQGRFATDIESGYLPVQDSSDHAEARLAASALSVRFPHEYNTTRWDITKEGFISAEIGATLPKENIQFAGGYEHPHGAGRSLELHSVGSITTVIGKNRDEEESLDIATMGQVILRFGADDTALPDQRRTIMTQNRGMADTLQKRTLQYWTSPKLTPGDAGDLTNKTGGESVSIRGALDGGCIFRFGARNVNASRRHFINGYQDGPGKQAWSVGDSGRMDAHTSGRPNYGAGDSVYAFHDLTEAGNPTSPMPPTFAWSGPPVTNMDRHGLSIDFHTVRDVLLRMGSNPESGQSLLMDLAGGIAAFIGEDQKGRSITATLDGGVELVIGQNDEQKGLRLEINGDVDWTINGNFHLLVTGDTVWESTTHSQITKTDHVVCAQKILHTALARYTSEAPDIVHNQGRYQSNENS